MKILIAEDNPTLCAMLKSRLQKAGHKVRAACDGIDVIHQVHEESPDLIVLNMFMPKMSGYQVCRLLKNDVSTSTIPIIMLARAKEREDKFWSLQTGADKFLPKGAHLSEALLKTIEELKAKRQPRKKKAVPSGTKSSLLNAIEVVSKVSSLLDRELHSSTTERLRLQVITKSLVEGLLSMDAHRRITLFNPMMERMTGYPEEEVLGKLCCEIFEDSLCQDGCYFEKVISSGTDKTDVELVLKNKNGKAVPVLSDSALLKNEKGDLVGIVSVLKDMTKLKEIERMKSDFVSMVTHELRTPLSIIKATADNVRSGVVGAVNPEQKDFLSIIIETSERLNHLVDSLLDLSKLELGKVQLNIEKIDLGELAKKCVASMTFLAQRGKIDLMCKTPKEFPLVPADYNRIEQVLLNLLSNAVKFTPTSGKITLELEEKGPMVQCTVADTGKGIPQEMLGKIFDKFQQIYDRESRRKGGTGLGLAVVKTIIEAHQGKIWVESEMGKGSKFIFTLPKTLRAISSQPRLKKAY